MDEGFGLLDRIIARVIDTVVIEFGLAIGHPVREHLAGAGAVLDPDRYGVPHPAHVRRFADRRTAIGRDLQQAVEGVFLVVTKFAQDRG